MLPSFTCLIKLSIRWTKPAMPTLSSWVLLWLLFLLGPTTSQAQVNYSIEPSGASSVVIPRAQWGRADQYAVLFPRQDCGNLKKLRVEVHLDTGPDHAAAPNASFTCSQQVVVTISSSGGTLTPSSVQTTLAITQAKAEHWRLLDVSQFLGSNSAANDIIIRVAVPSSPSTTGTPPTTSRISLRCVPEYETYAAASFTVVPTAPTPVAGYEQTLRWTSSCPLVTSYQLQLLHRPVKVARAAGQLSSTIASYDPNAQPSEAEWNRSGLLLETGSANLFYKLTLAEGEGVYHWRVRALGNQSGGATNPVNWGPWSLQDVKFAVTAPDAASNWIYSRSFSENGHVAEKLTFATGLQQVRQTQTRLATPTQSDTQLGEQVVAVQTVQDFAGRDAVTSLPIPLQGTGAGALGFKPALLARTPGIPYEAAHFDANATVRSPQTAQEQGYYSRSNDRVADAEGYPFSRTLFSNDGTNRVVEQGGVGDKLRVRASDAHTVRTSYNSVAPVEVFNLFGRESPQVEGLYKVITTDPNNVSSVTYQTKEGKTIATALAGVGAANAALQDLPSGAGSTTRIVESITGQGQLISKTLTLTEPQTLSINYSITPAQLAAGCINYCSSCDYQVRVRVVDVNGEPGADEVSTFAPVLVRAADRCSVGSIGLPSITDINLPAGTYRIEREVVPAEQYPVTATMPIVGPSTETRSLAQHLDKLRVELDKKFTNDARWSKISSYLDPEARGSFLNDVDELYRYLADQNLAQEVREGQPCYKIPIAGCADEFIYFPILANYCPPPFNPTAPGFEAELQAALAELNLRPDYAATPHTITELLTVSGYTAGQVDQLVTNMAGSTERDPITGQLRLSFPGEELQKCWGGLLASLEAMVYQGTGLPAGYQFNIVREFLQCTGINMTRPIAAPGTVSPTRAFEEFVYDPNNPAHQSCFSAIAVTSEDPSANQSPPSYTTVVANFSSSYDKEKRNQVYTCLQNFTGTTSTAPALTQAEVEEQTATLIQQARQACEDRRSEFRRVITLQLRQQGQYIEGDVYAWTPASGEGGVPTITQTPLAAGTVLLPTCEVESLVQDMVEQCKAECVLTPVRDSNGRVIAIGNLDEQKKLQQAMFGQLSVYVKNTSTDNCPNAVGWQPVPKVSSSGTRYGITTTTNEILAAIRTLTEGANRITTQATRPPLIGCTGRLNELNEKSLNIFSLATSFADWGFPSSQGCSVVGEPVYGSLLDARATRPAEGQFPDGRTSAFAFRTDYILITKRSPNVNGACLPTPTAAALPTGCANFLADAIETFKHHYFIRFVNPSTRQAYEKAQIRTISEPYFAPGAQFASSRTDDTSNGIYVRLMIQDLTSGRQHLVEAAIEVVNENDPYPVSNGDGVVAWKFNESTCPSATSTRQLCYKWGEPTTITPPSDDFPVFEPVAEACNVVAARRLLEAYQQQQNSWIQTQLTAFTNHFQQQCVALASLQETFTIGYNLGYHHFTLYYYDRAGNLTKTVPPAGVSRLSLTSPQVATLLTVARSNWPLPQHRLATTYTYNSLHQLEKQSSPDGGETHFFYNRKGQLRFSQNARQRNAQLPSYSYTRYDLLGRVTEVGESSTNATAPNAVGVELPQVVSELENMNFPPVDEVRQVTRTGYGDQGFTMAYRGQTQRYLTNRVAYSYYDVDGNPGSVADNSYTYYSYDPHGNVEWLGQEQAGLGRKFVRYEYDLISNKVTQVHYQEGEPDQFYHRYSYDGDNRLTQVQTSTDGVVWDQDARYTYFAHGPLKRLELGEDHVQGIDYTYTLQGWPKGVNHPGQDPGQDGTGTRLTASAKDAFGMSLGYFDGDYISDNTAWVAGAGSVLQPQHSLFNGNIASWTTKTRNDLTGAVGSIQPSQFEGAVGEQYRYDQLNRLKSSETAYHVATTGTFSPTADYATSYSYDPNGNLTSLTRNGASRFGQLAMDQLSYQYDTQNGRDNRLLRVNDPTPNQSYYADAIAQTNGTSAQYGYDEIGNLTSDATSGVSNITWNVYGKIEHVTQANGRAILYGYDAQGNRVRKTISTNNGAQLEHTFYVRDAQGNVLAVYQQQRQQSSGGLSAITTVSLIEQPIYGSSRLGLRKLTTGQSLPPVSNEYFDRLVGQKQYELVDHLGNVRALVGDTKRPDDAVASTYKPDLLAYYNYYPFGQMQPGRTAPNTATGSGGYRYGFNGKEQDNNRELGLTIYDFGARIYNPALGQFLSTDPLEKKFPNQSPFVVSANNPISLIDDNGNGPRLPGFIATVKALLYNPIIFDALFHANNTSVHGAYEWANGRAPREEGKILGAVGEAIAYERIVKRDDGLAPFYMLKSERFFGGYHNNLQIDIMQTQETGRVEVGGVALNHTLGIRKYSATGVFLGIEVFGISRRKQTWNVLAEVKTINPNNSAKTNYGYLSTGINQVIDRGEGDHNIGVLITDAQSWNNVMNDPVYGPQLAEDYKRLTGSGNFLQLEEGFYRESSRALHGLGDKLKEKVK
ncbi:RHS repeat-associated core domain-containing protein [Hymenobacter sp. BT186]|uniref:RHS repeat-associated core domain-containing protein n=1 Tax=Hymenobacter telluris TaxID=2816474 RepID=A0A939JEU6_9BACT|nr:RHS repeat-associated core domain-containing protein [Hymenobacter telluris]MBO0360805.1 RHS repeat-associated core domain-containing protein [Hymenobacter telluris]MBW3376834.1 hypothetical protein [Hymenobacter norwichensis]